MAAYVCWVLTAPLFLSMCDQLKSSWFSLTIPAMPCEAPVNVAAWGDRRLHAAKLTSYRIIAAPHLSLAGSSPLIILALRRNSRRGSAIRHPRSGTQQRTFPGGVWHLGGHLAGAACLGGARADYLIAGAWPQPIAVLSSATHYWRRPMKARLFPLLPHDVIAVADGPSRIMQAIIVRTAAAALHLAPPLVQPQI